jgi:hypothetical protein
MPIETHVKTRDNRARRYLSKVGYELFKSRTRVLGANDRGGYWFATRFAAGCPARAADRQPSARARRPQVGNEPLNIIEGEVVAEVPARYRPAVRSCRRCGGEFMSGWIGNRLCRNCARDDDRAAMRAWGV